MAYNGSLECPNDFLGCLDGKIFEDAECLTFSEFLAKYNGDVTQLYEILCCMSNLPDIFDSQNLPGTGVPFAVPGDETITQLVDGGAAPPNNEPKIITVNKTGNYLVTIKAQINSPTMDINKALLRVGVNGDAAGSIPLAGWDGYNNNPIDGTTTISGSRVYSGLTPGDTINAFGDAKTVSAGIVNYSLITLSVELALT